MCGDLDDDDGNLEAKLYARFVDHALALMAQNSGNAKGAAADLNQYLDKLFSDTLGRAVRDDEEAEPARRYERLAMQPVVFARLAGFLAAHLSLSEDPLRKVIEALMLGYSEAETMDPDRDVHHHHGDVYVGERQN
ncbi:MAG: hypothetical protein QOC56_1758 [Alphaproteobacteria bacterium]|jgi:hypothetical protein|nr:hypothetical protein [Alphaproteobacteria bacterium]